MTNLLVHKKKKSNEEIVKSDENTQNFTQFNITLFMIIIVLFLVSKFIPTFSKTINSPLILNHILPLIYFTIFSLCFGSTFIIGVKKMKGYLNQHSYYKNIDIGITAYTGTCSIIMAMFFKNIIQKLFGVKIKSSPLHDVVGFVLGKIILITIINYFYL
jgi:hypothetical protein